MIALETNSSKALILPERGGLVQSLFLNNQKVLFEPENLDIKETSWPGGGLPICFPFAGRVFHQGHMFYYELQNTIYQMPLHGFAYSLPWESQKISETECKLFLNDSRFTTSLYPFSFQVELHFILGENQFLTNVTIKHFKPIETPSQMPVAFGFHPYFLKTFKQLKTSAQKYFNVSPQGLAGKLYELPSNTLSSEDVLCKNAILCELSQSKFSFSSLNIEFGPSHLLQYLVLWSNNEIFQCIEPWMSLPDAVQTPSGVQWLREGEQLKLFLKISA